MALRLGNPGEKWEEETNKSRNRGKLIKMRIRRINNYVQLWQKYKRKVILVVCVWDYLNGRYLLISSDCFCLHSISLRASASTITITSPAIQTGKYAFNGNNLGWAPSSLFHFHSLPPIETALPHSTESHVCKCWWHCHLSIKCWEDYN